MQGSWSSGDAEVSFTKAVLGRQTRIDVRGSVQPLVLLQALQVSLSVHSHLKQMSHALFCCSCGSLLQHIAPASQRLVLQLPCLRHMPVFAECQRPA